MGDPSAPKGEGTSRLCASCGKRPVEHWVRPGVGSMYCERSGVDAKYERGDLSPSEQAESARIESALRAVVGSLADKLDPIDTPGVHHADERDV